MICHSLQEKDNLAFTCSSSLTLTDCAHSPRAPRPSLLSWLNSPLSLASHSWPCLPIKIQPTLHTSAPRSWSMPWGPSGHRLLFHRRHWQSMRMTPEKAYSYHNCLVQRLSLCGQSTTNKRTMEVEVFLKMQISRFLSRYTAGVE